MKKQQSIKELLESIRRRGSRLDKKLDRLENEGRHLTNTLKKHGTKRRR